jgi:tRNA pseudouridine38-40 synthase
LRLCAFVFDSIVPLFENRDATRFGWCPCFPGIQVTNYLLDLEFDGTAYCGWQYQPSQPTIQGSLELALAKLFGTEVPVIGAGRTDAGVSALRYRANFHAPRELAPEAIAAALNQRLPRDIRVHRARRVSPRFHARFDALGKVYRYTIVQGNSPLLRRQAWELECPIDRDRMVRGARLFLGRHDFASFCRVKPDNGIVAVHRVNVERRRSSLTRVGLVQIEIEADRLLYKMVRRMVGALVDVGRGKFELDELKQAITDRPRVQFTTAPACGLLLVRVRYNSFSYTNAAS